MGQHKRENNLHIFLETPSKLKVHKTFLRRLGRHINML